MAAVFIRRLAGYRRLRLPAAGDVRLGLAPAWLVIAALGARLIPGAPELAVVWADNALIFLSLPYLLVGLAVASRAIRGFGLSPILFVLALVLLPHVGIGLLALTGLLDTWFNFRAMINARIARRRDEGSSD